MKTLLNNQSTLFMKWLCLMDPKSLSEFCHIQKFDWYSTSRLETYCSFKGWCKKNYTTIVKMNIAVLRGYDCIYHCLVKLITDFLMYQAAIQTIFIGLASFALHFDKLYEQNWGFCKNWFCTKIDVNLDSDVLLRPIVAQRKA